MCSLDVVIESWYVFKFSSGKVEALKTDLLLKSCFSQSAPIAIILSSTSSCEVVLRIIQFNVIWFVSSLVFESILRMSSVALDLTRN